MAIQSDPQLEQLTQVDLIGIIRYLFARVESRVKEVWALCHENEPLKRKKADSQNSSRSPSCDQNTNSPSGNTKRKQRPPFGYKRFVRLLVYNHDRVIRFDTNQRESCRHYLSATELSKVIRRQITELSEIKPIVPGMQQEEKDWQDHQYFNRYTILEGLKDDRYFRPLSESSLVFLKHQNDFSCQCIVHVFREPVGLEISERGLVAVIAGARKLAAGSTVELCHTVISSPIIQKALA